jgi:hypothetical protein
MIESVEVWVLMMSHFVKFDVLNGFATIVAGCFVRHCKGLVGMSVVD